MQKKASSYLIRNWKEYNQSLVNRGSITFWFNQKAIKKWHAKCKASRGRPFFYSDEAITCALILKAVFHLTFRATQGYVGSIISLMGLDIKCPDYTVFCRRAKDLKIPLCVRSFSEPLHVIFDATGLKVYGEGEWKVRKYGYTKRRTWKKLHLGMCARTQQILVNQLTDNSSIDADPFPEMMESINDLKIERVTGDGGYDKVKCYQAIYQAGAQAIIPPQEGARKLYWKHGEPVKSRDQTIEDIKKFGDDGLKKWKKQVDYHKRSLIETAMYRFKTLFGDKLRCRKEWSERTEAAIKCMALNQMTSLGMPKSYKCNKGKGNFAFPLP